MCGFLYQKKILKNFKLNKKLFKKSSNLLIHRGPDFKKFLLKNNDFIYHSRLKILDLLDRSNQPMTREGYTIIYNGEIYNFRHLRSLLEKEYQFQTKSDTEVLLYSYLKWKEKMFEKIEGMYSFVIINLIKNTVFFARDLFGQKPLYYFKNKKNLIFSSEIKPILKLNNFKNSKFNDSEIYKYLNLNYYSDDNETFFKDIKQVKPGMYGYYEANKLIFKKIKISQFKKKINTNNLLNLITSEIGNHLVSDVKTGIMISEGTDSKALNDISKKIFNKNLKLFNLEFQDFNNTEFRTKYYKLRKNIFFSKFYKKEMMHYLDKTSNICEAPPLGLFSLGMVKLFQNIKKNRIKVVLNGQGVDEIFGGYNLFFKKIDVDKVYHPDGKIFTPNKSYFKKKINNSNNIKKNIIMHREEMAFKSKIPKNLNQIDKISMNYSIECRSPFLTNNFASLINRLRFKDLKKGNHLKYIFRNCLYKLTKDKYYFNDKRFKQAPQTEFMLSKSNIKKIEKIINKKNYCDKYFNKKHITKYFQEFLLKKNNGFIIWQYLSLNSFINNFKNI